MNPKDIKLIGNYIQKLYRVFLLFVGLVTAVEFVLVLRGILAFDLTRLKHRMYLYSYLFLMLVSAVTLVVLLLCRNREEHITRIVRQTYIYAACLIVWAAFVTCIDCMADGDSGVMVYIMVCISVGGLLLVNPIFYSILLCASGAALLGAVLILRGQPYSLGFYANFIVFIILAIFINAQNYRIRQKEYASGEKLKRLSYTDQLTGVYNRRHLDIQIAKCAESNESYLFMLIDVDDFKKVNDTYGHAIGDKCLVLIAKILGEFFGDQVYRFGGDEFAVICDLSRDEACRRIDKVNYELSCSCNEFALHISAGVYRAQRCDSASAVFIRTDKALYQAKLDGKNACRIFEEP